MIFIEFNYNNEFYNNYNGSIIYIYLFNYTTKDLTEHYLSKEIIINSLFQTFRQRKKNFIYFQNEALKFFLKIYRMFVLINFESIKFKQIQFYF